MSKSIEALNRIETVVPFNRENKPNYYSQFMQSETPFYEDFDLVKKDLEVLAELEILKKYYPPFKKFLEEMFEKGYNKDLTKVKEWLENEN